MPEPPLMCQVDTMLSADADGALDPDRPSPLHFPPALAADATTVYKGTTLPHIVVRRRLQLTPEGFTTYQHDKTPSTGKAWLFHRRTVLEPAITQHIRVHDRHLRKAGPLRALSAYARDKNVLKLYCFRVEWPDKYAPSHGSSVELGFETLSEARLWHEQIHNQILALGQLQTAGSLVRQYSGFAANGSLMFHASGLTSAEASVDPSPFTSPVSSFPTTPNLLSKQPSLVVGSDAGVSPNPATAAGGTAAGHRRTGSHGRHSSHPGGPEATLKSLATGATRQDSPNSSASSHSSSSSSGSNVQQHAPGRPVSGRASAGGRRGHQPSAGGASTTGVVVDECMVRWVPYKHANGTAIYYRQTPQEEGMPQASGEYMLSTAVQASPECCVSNLMLKADKNGSVLSTAAFMEVLEDNGDMQVWHMVFHPAGSAGLATVLAAPRHTFMHQVLTSYEEGVYAVLFSSVPDEDVKPEWLERANARTQRAHRAVLRSDPGSGSRKPLWQTPVRCNITGAITLSALEGRSGRDSPQTLVTCIVRADFGGWLSSKSAFYGLGQALGLQEALLDRVLMRVMILKEDVEYSRFKTKPFQLLMMQPEDYDTSSSGDASQQQKQQHNQQQCGATGRHSSAPMVVSLCGSAAAAAAVSPEPPHVRSGASAPARSSAAGAAAAAAAAADARAAADGIAAAAAGAACAAAGDGGDDAPSKPGAVAVAAARVSAAASALAAHMTNPQQLWHEKRGSSAGLSIGPSAANTPPHSPQKHAGTPSPFAASSPRLKQQLRATSDGKAGATNAAAAGSGVPAAAAAAAAVAQREQRVPARAAPGSSDRFYSVTDASSDQQQQQQAPAEGSSASLQSAVSGDLPGPAGASPAAAAAAGNGVDKSKGSFSSSSSSSSSSSAELSTASSGGELAADGAAAGSSSGGLPYSEEQLSAMVGGTLARRYWEPIHDGVGSVRDVYSIRGPTYLRDRKKVPAGKGRYKLMAADLVGTEGMIDHIARFLPSVRCSGAAFSFVVDLIINYGNPVLHLVMVFSTDRHPNSLGPCPDDPLDAGEEWTPFDFTMSRFLHGTDEERNGMFKLIPHCAKGSWVVSQSVGTTPVILGRKLATTYHSHERYMEVDVDVASTPAVSYIVKMVQGATKSMLIDHAYLLESQFAHELPETLIGAIRYKWLDMADYTFLQVDQELPFSPVLPGIVGQ